ncbi:MAG: hypothetical protein JO072_14960 [Parafilimonas sp.]|nr:hypothetical protein [Parafilimonas sp.]
MKQLFITACVLCMLAACNNATTSSGNTDTTASASTMSSDQNQNVSYAYPVQYSSDFTIGDSKYAQTVLELWKDFDNNTFDNHKDAFDDSVTMDLSGGMHVKGKDSCLAGAKQYRGTLKNVVSSVSAITTLKPKGKDETWVCVWGTEVDTHNNGKIDSVYYNENWMFNKDGKIAYMEQFQATPAKK